MICKKLTNQFKWFVTFNSTHLQRIQSYLNFRHGNIYSIVENEKGRKNPWIKFTTLQLPFTGNEPLVEFILILPVFHQSQNLIWFIPSTSIERVRYLRSLI